MSFRSHNFYDRDTTDSIEEFKNNIKRLLKSIKFNDVRKKT